jgi:hypothetical protein
MLPGRWQHRSKIRRSATCSRRRSCAQSPAETFIPDGVAVEAPGGVDVVDREACEGSRSRGSLPLLCLDVDLHKRRLNGLDGVAQPIRAGEKVTFLTTGFDSGTAMNTEDFADIVPPCQTLIGASSGEPGTGTSRPSGGELE